MLCSVNQHLPVLLEGRRASHPDHARADSHSGCRVEPRKRHELLPVPPSSEVKVRAVLMTDWIAVLLLCATYALAVVWSGAVPAVRRRRPQFDAILPTPKRAQLRVLRGSLG